MPNLFLYYDKKKLYYSGFYVAVDFGGTNITHLKVPGTLFYVGQFPLPRTLMVYYQEVLDGGIISAEKKRTVALNEAGHKYYLYLNIHNALLGTLQQHKQWSFCLMV